MSWSVTPPTATAGAAITAAAWNNVRDILLGAGTWAAYSPVWTSTGSYPSIGNGALTGCYTVIGDAVDLNLYLSIGSTTTQGSGTWAFSLPPGMAVASGFALGGCGSCSDGTQRPLFAFGAPSGTSVVAVSGLGATLGPTSPYTFPTGGWLALSARFRKA